ncbi:hypothetical protein A3D11_01170 [Candidatus Peribacteria bacterium RIFCSPHIGHO2_02_FULL_49_16]|nr:MAG: hypothetical protein A2880_02900 [Candidatus Peribacteria bacterium RIFCSPHIGHO2_01_FULL_49_38]OGJ58732.1 MAG: hypothetical protein A3D11_01170 [Candidatus Peribacteria bacterium RIFCSPHIGHO2_02_FULL_49_16]
MVVYARKKKSESNDSLQQRFKKQVQKTGIMGVLRSRSRFSKPKNRLTQRKRALHREKLRAENKKKQFYSAM